MTLIISWIGVDDKKSGKEIASIYLASDSRYSWGAVDNYDCAPKVFGSTKYPEILGFCGDVVFPTTTIQTIIQQIDNGLLINETDDAVTKNKKIFNEINSSFDKYPQKQLAGKTFTILHATRAENIFKLYKISFENKELYNEEISLPAISTVVYSGGSGKKEFDNNWLNWKNENHNDYRTSRAAYHCFNKTLKSIRDPLIGGKSQIVGLYRKGSAQCFGIIEEEKKFVYGKEFSEDMNPTNIEWRNENFERMNPETLMILEGAQRQPS